MKRHPDGFTLIELLVAIAVFSILALIAYGGLQSLLLGRDDVEREMQRLSELQMLFLNMQQDLEQAVNRPLRGAYGDELPGFAAEVDGGSLYIELTRAGWRNPMSRARSHLLRVAYRLHDGRLERSYWNVLDRAQDTQSSSRILMENIRGIKLRFLSATGEWIEQWSPADAEADQPLPRAVEITLELENWGQVRRIFSLAV
jgi:general secretion pathway protein J